MRRSEARNEKPVTKPDEHKESAAQHGRYNEVRALVTLTNQLMPRSNVSSGLSTKRSARHHMPGAPLPPAIELPTGSGIAEEWQVDRSHRVGEWGGVRGAVDGGREAVRQNMSGRR